MSRTTFFLGDLHLTDVETGPGARFYKRPEALRDSQLVQCLEWMLDAHDDPRLVLTGDIFDLDLVVLDDAPREPGASAAAKLCRIFSDHAEVMRCLARFAEAGNLHLLMGNHDLELSLPEARQALTGALDECIFGAGSGIRLHGWAMYEPGVFWAEHGHIYDTFACTPDPLDPSLGSGVYFPFGCLVNQNLSNALTSFNPSNDDQVMQGLAGYVSHWLRYEFRPPWKLPVRYLRSAVRAYVQALQQRRAAHLPDPDDLARRASEQIGISAEQARHLLSFRPIPVAYLNAVEPLRTLYLDKAIALGVLAAGAAAWMAAGDSATDLWFPPVLALGLFFTYEWLMGPSRAKGKTKALPDSAIRAALKLDVPFAVLGHAHEPECTQSEGRVYLNAGSWAPIYEDVECTRRLPYTDTLVRIDHGDGAPDAALLAWRDGRAVLYPENER